MFFSITVDNTYENIDTVGEMLAHAASEDDFEPEEMYIIPNCARTITSNQDNMATPDVDTSQGKQDT